jgi:cobalt ECF transporter T component CbiQ
VSFLEQSLARLAAALDFTATAEALAGRPGLLQSLDPRAKLVGLLPLLLVAAVTRTLAVTIGVFVLALLLALASRIPLHLLASRVWIVVLAFSGVVALPAVFLTPGPAVWRLPAVGWVATSTGLLTATRLVARAETAATLAVLVVLTTPWPSLLKALRVLGTPPLVVTLLAMSQRYSTLLCRAAIDLLEGRRSRLLGPLAGAERRALAAGTAGVLLSRSLDWSHEVHLAMLARGFRGEHRTLDDFRFRTRDGVAVGLLLLAAGTTLWFG